MTSKSTYEQTANLISRCGVNVHIVVDEYEQGPVRGIMVGLEHTHIDESIPTYVIFSDAVIDESLQSTYNSWIGVTNEFDSGRPWCYTNALHKRGFFRDGIPDPIESVITVGVYKFGDTRALYGAASSVMYEFRAEVEKGPIQMAPLLSAYDTADSTTILRNFTTWRDVGDIFSLAAARHRKFHSRARHILTLTRDGILHKNGASDAEMDFYDSLGERGLDVQTLFPTHYGTDRTLRRYSMEYIDLPTLAELWLYWPGLPQTWAGIVSSLVERLMHSLWLDHSGEESDITAGEWMAQKAIQRQERYRGSIPHLRTKIHALGEIIGDDVWVNGHGDLNFTNIMYSINTGNFKLIDPRGGRIPLIYEFGKLGYSHIFSSIVHGLYIKHEDWSIVLPSRLEEITAINDVLLRYVSEERLYATMALILLAAPPLHTKEEAEMLNALGLQMMGDLV